MVPDVSLKSFPLLEALTFCSDLLERFGGHSCAAGFSLPVENIPELRQRLNEFAANLLRHEDLEPQLEIETELSFSDLSTSLVEELSLLAPHGYGNPQPVFAARNTRPSGQPRLLKERHLKVKVAQHDCVLDAIE